MATSERSKNRTEQRAAIEIGFHTFTEDGGEEFGAVRDVNDDTIVVYVENAGDFTIPRSAIRAVHSQKVVVDCAVLDPDVRAAIGHAHDAEEPGL
jgi:hypothetical protein